jgi:putative membrane protein
MTLARFALVLGGLSFLSLLTAVAVRASDTVSDADRAFVAKVSQGGMYEVELGKLAEVSAAKQDVKDQGNTEMHDHTLVGEKLKSITQANSIEFPSQLNAEFQSRLDKFRSMPSSKFDTAYIEDMEKIHDADGAAFAQEANSGTNSDLKAFAAETVRIVERHLGELNAKAH